MSGHLLLFSTDITKPTAALTGNGTPAGEIRLGVGVLTYRDVADVDDLIAAAQELRMMLADAQAAGSPSETPLPSRPLSAGEKDPDAPWCPGCGFANYSSGPCEVCGHDDQNVSRPGHGAQRDAATAAVEVHETAGPGHTDDPLAEYQAASNELHYAEQDVSRPGETLGLLPDPPGAVPADAAGPGYTHGVALPVMAPECENDNHENCRDVADGYRCDCVCHAPPLPQRKPSWQAAINAELSEGALKRGVPLESLAPGQEDEAQT